jgi:SET domain-containing protein
MIKSIYSDKVEIGESDINGMGTFAKEDINKGEMIYIRGGHILPKGNAFRYKEADGIWPITDDYELGAIDEIEFEKQKVNVNHSCNPNCGLRGEITCVAMRDIKKGEEITQDYGLLDDIENYSFDCKCSSPNCRKKITGKDWQIKELQEKYFDYFAAYLKEKIKNINSK